MGMTPLRTTGREDDGGAFPAGDEILRWLGRGVYREDPLPELMRDGDLSPLGEGSFAYRRRLLHAMETLDTIVKHTFSEFTFEGGLYPSVVPAAHLSKLNYFAEFGHHCCFLADVRNAKVAAEHSRQGEEPGNLAEGPLVCKGDLRVGQELLTPSACFGCFESLAGSRLPDNRCFTMRVQCFRREEASARFPRLKAYWVREMVFVGEMGCVQKALARSRGLAHELMTRLELAGSLCVAADSFLPQWERKAAAQKILRSKYELRADIPFSDGSVAVGSINDHRDTMVAAFNIQAPEHQTAWSGCVGFGLERLAYGWLCQYGVDMKKWPDYMRSPCCATRPSESDYNAPGRED